MISVDDHAMMTTGSTAIIDTGTSITILDGTLASEINTRLGGWPASTTSDVFYLFDCATVQSLRSVTFTLANFNFTLTI
eukprot:jgi/Hompol1/2907/HPOL_006221-RA